MEFVLLGDVDDGPTLRLHHEEFAYAGKFVMSNTGKIVARDADEILGAIAFNQNHDDSTTAVLRYVTVRESCRGERIGPKLLRFAGDTLSDQYESVTIAVNNPIAYEAAYRAGFVWTGEQRGIAELELVYQPDSTRDTERYQEGFGIFGARDLPTEHQRLVEQYEDSEPPAIVAVPDGKGTS